MGKNCFYKVSVKRIVWLAVTALCLSFVLLCRHIPELADWYMQHCYPAIATVLSAISYLLPLSLFDILTLFAIILFLGGIVWMLRRRLHFKRWLYLFLMATAWVGCWFYLSWGICYFRPDFFSRFQLAKPQLHINDFEVLTLRLIDSLNISYHSISLQDKDELDSSIEQAYSRMHKKLQLPYPCGKRRTKSSIYEPLQRKMGISGFFGPFFNEVHVTNAGTPPSYSFTLAHEKAHQLGIGSEAECNLFAYVVCTSSASREVKYSGYYSVVKYLLSSLYKLDPEKYKQAYSCISNQVKDDFAAERAYWKQAINPRAASVQQKVYNSYLKSNKVDSGIESYSEVVLLLIAWERKKQSNVLQISFL